MRKLILMTILAGGLGLSSSAVAAERQPDSYGEANYLYTSEFVALDESGLGKLEIWLDNVTDNFNSYQMDLYLPDGFTIAKSGRSFDVKPNNGNESDSKTVDHTITVQDNTDYFRILGFSMTQQWIWTSDDLLLTVAIQAPEGFDTNSVVFCQLRNIKIAAGNTGAAAHVFPDIECEMENPIPLVMASGNKDIWDYEWQDGSIQLPLEFLYASDNKSASIESEDVSFEIKPLFEQEDGEDAVGLGSEIASYSSEGEGFSVSFRCPGLYDVNLKVARGTRYTIDGKKSLQVKTANIYPSLDGLNLSYQSMTEGNPLKEFYPREGNELHYAFEVSDASEENWYHNNAKFPNVHLQEEDVEIWYKLHGLDQVEIPVAPMSMKRAPADPDANGYSQATEENVIDISKMAYTSEGSVAQLSFILKKNGAATPLLSEDGDSRSVQLLTLVKTSNVETGIEEISADSLDEEDTFFDLQGRKVKNPVPGIYIQNGRKVLVK